MKKLSLDLETLTVETFDTEATLEQRGTVRGAESEAGSCNPDDSCSCQASCGTCLPCSVASMCVCYPDYGGTDSDGQSCTAPSCVYTCTTCNPYGCGSCH